MIIGPRVARSIAYSLACVLTAAASCLPLPPSCLAQGNDQLQISNATLGVCFDFTPANLLRRLMMARIKLSAKAVAAYYPQYPVSAVEIRLHSHRGHGINSGHAFGFPRAHLSIAEGVDRTEPDLAED